MNKVCVLSNSRPSRDLHKDVKDPAVEIWRWMKAAENDTLFLRTAPTVCYGAGARSACPVAAVHTESRMCCGSCRGGASSFL